MQSTFARRVGFLTCRGFGTILMRTRDIVAARWILRLANCLTDWSCSRGRRTKVVYLNDLALLHETLEPDSVPSRSRASKPGQLCLCITGSNLQSIVNGNE